MKLIIIFCAVLFTAITSYAQDTLHNDVNAKAQSVALKLERELQLNTDQQREVQTVLETYFENIEQRSQNKKAAHDQSLQAIQKILTEEQYRKFIALREKTREQKEEFKREHPDYKFSEEDEQLDF